MMTEKEVDAINDEMIERLKALPLHDCEDDQWHRSMHDEFITASEFYADKLRAAGTSVAERIVAALYLSQGRYATPESVACGLAMALADLAPTQDGRDRLLAEADAIRDAEFAYMESAEAEAA